MMPPQYPFTDFKVVQTFKKLELALQWKVDPGFNDIGPFKFTVEVSESPDFKELTYTIPSTNSFSAIDNLKVRQGESVDFYYRVKLETGSPKTYYSSTITHWAKGEKRSLFLKAKEIVRREFVRYRYTGQLGWLLKRKNYGEKDPANLDPITGVPLTNDGPDFGTGFTGGYYSPLRVTYSRESIEAGSQLHEQGFGTATQEAQRHRYVGFPNIEPNDILVTDTNQRYRYDRVNSIYMPGTDIIIIQSCNALLLPPTDPIYSIAITP